MHDGTIRPGARYCVEAEALDQVIAGTVFGQLGSGGQLVEIARWRFLSEPGKKICQRGPIAQMGGTGAVQFDFVLQGFGQRAGVFGMARFGPAIAQPLRDPRGSGGRIDRNLLSRTCEAVEHIAERCALVNPNLGAQMLPKPGCEFTLIDQQVDAGIGVQHGERERQGSARNIGAADIEQPGDRIGCG